MGKTRREKRDNQELKAGIQARRDLWQRMEDGDRDALIKLSAERGMMTEEDLDLIKRIDAAEEDEGN